MRTIFWNVRILGSIGIGSIGIGSYYSHTHASAVSPRKSHQSRQSTINGMDLNRLSRLDDWIDESVKQGILPGASYAVFRGNKLIRQSYHGYSNIERKEPITKDTLFRMYSMTKPIISVGLMMLYEQGKFDLTDPVSKYIPNFGKIPGIYDYESNKDLPLEDITMDNIATNKVKLKPIKKPILMWQLMTHMSGLSYYFDKKGVFEPVDKLYGELFGSMESTHGFDNMLLSDVIDNTITKLPLCYEPGTRWGYSFGIDVIGRLIEVISGMPLDEYLYENIFKPLGMNHTAFYIDSKYGKELKSENLAVLYGPNKNYKQDGKLLAPFTGNSIHSQTNKQYGTLFMGGGSGGGLISSLDDYIKFAQMLYNKGKCIETGEQILSSKTVEFMTQNHLSPDDRAYVTIIHDHSPLIPFARKGVGCGLGFGVVVSNKAPDSKAFYQAPGSFYWNGAGNTKWWVDPKNDLFVVFMTQVLAPTTDLQSKIDRFVYNSIVE